MFNVLRYQKPVRHVQLALHAARRHNSTAFVPPAALDDVQPPSRRIPIKQKPATSTFYTARSDYYDQVELLETSIKTTRQALKTLHLDPLPRFAKLSVPAAKPAWKPKETLIEASEIRMTPSRYRRIVTLLNQLDEYRRTAEAAGYEELAEHVSELLSCYEKPNKDNLMNKQTKPVEFDEHGRSYTIGRRKESTARVWVIPVIEPEVKATQEPEEPMRDKSLDGLVASVPRKAQTKAPPAVDLPTTNIIVNNVPLSKYFSLPADRERVVRPLKMAGLLGAYNVFVIVRGGGPSGQSGAISLGLAKGLVAHEPDVEDILRKAKLLRRDPRMVERKKTGLRKARAARTWVKR